MGCLCGESDLPTDRWPLGECLVGGCVVREGGLEPPHPFGHRHLKPARLPIPPLARGAHEVRGRDYRNPSENPPG